jgi:transcriptional regulator with XRE-family HTH domain
VTVNTENPDTPGSRLRAYIDDRWPRNKRGILGLAKVLNTSTETMYEWFRDDREPSLDHLTRLAEALNEGATRSEILAVMDGEASAVRLDGPTRTAIRAEVEAALDERLGPPKAPRG